MKGKARTKIGSGRGNPAYRTPSNFRYRKFLKVNKSALKNMM